jgi:hypothetical protein
LKRALRLAALTALAAGALALAPAAANADVTLTPSNLSFSQPVGTASAPKAATLTLTCDGCDPEGPLTDSFDPVITVTPAAFTQTNDCPTTLLASFLLSKVSCTINVAFAASAVGTVSGTLTTGPGGPTASLTGTGVAPTTPAPARKKCKKGKKKPKGAAAAKKKCGKRKKGGK